MAIETTRYIKKPLYVEAVRITAENFDEVTSWCHGEIQEEEVPGKGTIKKFIKVRVHNPSPNNARQTKAYVGDWLLYTERGYKIYTHKAFIASFDEVGEEISGTVETLNADAVFDFPLFYLDETYGWLTDVPPHEEARALTFEELMTIIKNEVSNENRLLRMEREAALHRARSINRSGVETVENVPNQESIVPAAAEGKRVLSIVEQREMTATEVRELVQSGEAVLVQDLPDSRNGRPSWTNGMD
jgi:hypothetical protein